MKVANHSERVFMKGDSGKAPFLTLMQSISEPIFYICFARTLNLEKAVGPRKTQKSQRDIKLHIITHKGA